MEQRYKFDGQALFLVPLHFGGARFFPVTLGKPCLQVTARWLQLELVCFPNLSSAERLETLIFLSKLEIFFFHNFNFFPE